MLKVLIILEICLHFRTPVTQTLKQCDPSYCSHEGQCFDGNNVKTCLCIGDNYFRGPSCTVIVDNCRSSPCQNSGQCQGLVGQFMCRNCKEGYGGLWCDVEMGSVFENMALYFNHYGYYSKSQKFLIIVENVGSVNFSVELVGDNYVVDSFETDANNHKSQWNYSSDLVTTIKNYGIRYYNDLPFSRGFYHLAQERFWDLGMLKLTLRAYDTETASDLLYLHIYDLLIFKSDTLKCVPQLKFAHGSNPMDPLLLDIARFNNFEPLVLHRCATNSRVIFKWLVFNSIGNKMLHDFGTTHIPLLKVPPYRLWFNYQGEVMSSYSMVVTMIEQSNRIEVTTEARCFIFVLPKPVKATIKGGVHREIGVEQHLILDGSTSRDFALAPHAKQDLSYRWDCLSLDDPQNRFCQPNISTRNLVEIGKGRLTLNASYQFTLAIQSKVNHFISDEARQQLVIVHNPQLFITIKCVRNCLHNRFTSDKIIHLEIQCVSEGGCPPNAKFYWTLNGAGKCEERRCLYSPKELEKSLLFKADVWHKGLQGKTSTELTRNLPPMGGSCSIEPSSGVAFVTEFHIKCRNYEDLDTPLSFQYMSGDFPLERINDPEAVVVLPESAVVVILICDQLDACIDTRLLVNVSALPEPGNLKDFLSVGKSNVNVLIENGHKLALIMLVKSLLKYLKNEFNVLEMAKQLENFTLLTLLEVEQWLVICHDLNNHILPLDNRKTLALSGYFRKLSRGLQIVIEDREILDMHVKPYENALTQVGSIVQEFAKPWETIPEVHTSLPQVVKISDPLAEQYTQLPDFDIFVLDRIANWLETSREIFRCFNLLSLQSVHIYHPKETPFIVDDGLFRMKLYPLEEITEHRINISNQSMEVELELELEISSDVIKDLQRQLHSKPIVLQVASMKLNNFWWYPDDRPVTMSSLYLSAFAKKSSPQTQLNLTNPFVSTFHLNESEILHSNPEFEGVITGHLHMPIYSLQLPSNAAVIATLQETERDVLLEIGIGQRPRSSSIRTSQQIFRSNNTSPQKCAAINGGSQTLEAFIAVLATKEVNEFPFSFKFHLNIVECLSWDWTLNDPQWVSRGCIPMLRFDIFEELKCECYHLSAFAVKNYPSPATEDLRDRSLFESVPLSRYLVTFYTALFLTFGGILVYNFRRSQNLEDMLMSDASSDNNDVEVHICTGSHWNSSSSANIQLRFISERGPYSVTIYQQSQKPQLQRNSRCQIRLSSHNVSIPLKLTITNDQSGRYPSWYCHEISVINQTTNQSQVFTINKWISKQPLEAIHSNSTPTFSKQFMRNLANFYTNWFQFQPILGPVIYGDVCCFQRSCLWVSQFMVSLCIIACHYGPTTMDSYEEEREFYYSLNFNVTELIVLPFICFTSSIFIKCFFSIMQTVW